MKILVVILNFLLLGTGVFVAVELGIPRPDENDFYLVLLIFSTPIATLLYLLFPKDGWIDLWFKRKAAEERKKLKEIEPK